MNNDLVQLPAVMVGHIVDVDELGVPSVRWNGSNPTRASVVWMASAPRWHDCVGARVILGFLDGDERQPVVLGLLDPPCSANQTPETIRLESSRELLLQCGEARIYLRQDGRIEIRGTHVISRSSGPNKVKGGAVFIN